MLTFILIHHIVSVSLFFIGFVTFVFVTRGRRPIANILAWLFFMFLVPYLAIPLFLIIGQRKLNWVLTQKRELHQQSPRQLAHETPIEALLNTFGVLPPSEGNSVQLLEDGVIAYQTIMEQIENAEHSILICTYRISNDEVGNAVVQALTAKAKQGVQVCLLLDTIGCFFTFPRSKLKPLKKAGGSVRYIMPLFHTPFRGRVNLRDHRKIMIFDGKYSITGGMNLAADYMGPTPDAKRWIDISVLMKGNVVKDLLSVFESDWKFAASNMEYKSYQRPTISSCHPGDSIIQTVASGPDTIGDRLYDAVISSIYNARNCINIVTPYFILDEGLQKAFMIALRRGVKVNLIIPKKSNHPTPDLVRSIMLRKLHSEGANIYFVPKMIHAKVFSFDDKLAVVGSANLDLRSLLLNFEISCFYYSADDVAKIKAWIEQIMPECSTEMKKPSLRRMWLEDAAQLIKPLL